MGTRGGTGRCGCQPGDRHGKFVRGNLQLEAATSSPATDTGWSAVCGRCQRSPVVCSACHMKELQGGAARGVPQRLQQLLRWQAPAATAAELGSCIRAGQRVRPPKRDARRLAGADTVAGNPPGRRCRRRRTAVPAIAALASSGNCSRAGQSVRPPNRGAPRLTQILWQSTHQSSRETAVGGRAVGWLGVAP